MREWLGQCGRPAAQRQQASLNRRGKSTLVWLPRVANAVAATLASLNPEATQNSVPQPHGSTDD